MATNTPKFWYERKGFIPKLLSALYTPLACVYAIGDKLNSSNKVPKEISLPIICIGNLNVGGAGKTPTCIEVSNILKEHNYFIEPIFLTRGYGGKVIGSEFVDRSKDAEIWGDEPLLLSAHARTIVSKNRYQGAQLAMHSDADVIIMDDGFHNNTLKKDINIVVVDGHFGFGNQKTIPAGPLRQPLEQGLDKADAFIIVGADAYGLKDILPINTPVFYGEIKVKTGLKIDKKKDYLAFCGIAHPDKFKKTLENNNIKIKDIIAFPDHHKFTNNDFKRLSKRAEKDNLALITTEKDYVRIPDSEFRKDVITLPIEMYFKAKEKNSLREFILKSLESSST